VISRQQLVREFTTPTAGVFAEADVSVHERRLSSNPPAMPNWQWRKGAEALTRGCHDTRGRSQADAMGVTRGGPGKAPLRANCGICRDFPR
jgi:hypothetical protein